MKSFLLRGKHPIIRWSMLPDETYFEGTLPEGYALAVMPSGNYIIVDVDRHGAISGFDNIPEHVKDDLYATLNYATKNNGRHFWFRYTGKVPLANKTSGKGIDLRVGYKGYVVWYPKDDIRTRLHEINETSDIINEWLIELFSYSQTKVAIKKRTLKQYQNV